MKHSASCAKHLDLDFVAERCELVSKRDVKFVDILFTNFKVIKSLLPIVSQTLVFTWSYAILLFLSGISFYLASLMLNPTRVWQIRPRIPITLIYQERHTLFTALWWLPLVRPDDGIKSCPIFHNIAQKVAKSFFGTKVALFKKAQFFLVYSDNFCKNFFYQEDKNRPIWSHMLQYACFLRWKFEQILSPFANANSVRVWITKMQSEKASDLVVMGGDQCDQKKSPNVYNTCPKMILLEKWWILSPLQKFL